jgi:hypothetical protein
VARQPRRTHQLIGRSEIIASVFFVTVIAWLTLVALSLGV